MANGLQVIYIEDDELVRRASVQSLQLAGFDVDGYASAEAASKRSNVSMTNYINSAIVAMLRRFARPMRYPPVEAALLVVLMIVASGGHASAAAVAFKITGSDKGIW